MPVNPDRVGVHLLHQREILTILIPRHGAEPGGTDVVAAFNKQSSVIDSPAFVIRLFLQFAQTRPGDDGVHYPLVIHQGGADPVQVRLAIACRPPEPGTFHGQRDAQGLDLTIRLCQVYRKVLLNTLAVKIIRCSRQAQGHWPVRLRPVANVGAQHRVFQPLAPVRAEDHVVDGDAAAQMQFHRCPDPAGVSILTLLRPGTTGAGVVLVKNPFKQRFVQRPDCFGIFPGAVYPNSEPIVAAQRLSDIYRESLEIALVTGEIFAVKRHPGKIVHAIKYQGSHGIRGTFGQRKFVPVPQSTLMIVSGAVPVGRHPKRTPAPVRSAGPVKGGIVGIVYPPHPRQRPGDRLARQRQRRAEHQQQTKFRDHTSPPALCGVAMRRCARPQRSAPGAAG